MGLFDFIGDVVSELTTSGKKHYSFSWVIFGGKGAGKHELLATIAYCEDFLEGFPHAKNFADIWQKSFSKEDDEGLVTKMEVLLLEPDSQEPQRMLKNAKKHIKILGNGDFDFPCFLVNFKQFLQDGALVLHTLFAQYLFFWRAILERSYTGQYNGEFDPDYMDSVASEYFDEGFNDSSFKWNLILTHLDEIPEKNLERSKKKFLKSYEKAKEEALNSTFGNLFEQIFDKVTVNTIFVDLFHKNGRVSAYTNLLQQLDE